MRPRLSVSQIDHTLFPGRPKGIGIALADNRQQAADSRQDTGDSSQQSADSRQPNNYARGHYTIGKMRGIKQLPRAPLT